MKKKLQPSFLCMDGKGHALDNVIVEKLWRSVKYECIYAYGYENMLEVRIGLNKYFKNATIKSS